MTASSIELFPCRVGVIHREESNTNSTRAQIAVPSPPARPPLATLQRVRRNLFGSAEPGSVDQLALDEKEKKRSYFLQRYNFDISTSMPIGGIVPEGLVQERIVPASTASNGFVSTCDTETTTTTTNTLPSLIAQECRQHEQRLRQEECNLNNASVYDHSSEVNQEGSKINHQAKDVTKRTYSVQELKWHNRSLMANNCPLEGRCSNNGGNSERLKPYSKQTLITDCYSLRRGTSQQHSNNGQNAIGTSTSSNRNNTRSPMRQREVLHLPKPKRGLAVSTINNSTSCNFVQKSLIKSSPLQELTVTESSPLSPLSSSSSKT